MRIHQVRVKNFRSILDESLRLDSLTALVGRNGAGKSSFLSALELFYTPALSVVREDFYAEDTSREIEIAVTYGDLSTEEATFFAAYVDGSTLTVACVFRADSNRGSGTYHGESIQHPAFAPIRATDGARELQRRYNELRKNGQYSSLPSVRSAEQARIAMSDWEREHPTECVRRRDDGRFFGFTQVGQGYLGRYTRFIRVPAVREAGDDATEGRGSSITQLMDLVVRNKLAQRPDLADFRQRTQAEYERLMDEDNLPELGTLGDDLSRTLGTYAPNAAVALRWADLANIEMPLPRADVRLTEDGYSSTVQRTGHGLQRAFILTMLQHLATTSEAPPTPRPVNGDEKADPDPTPNPTLILAIEEPELYQHPSRQRHLASVLLELAEAKIAGVAEHTQVIYTTHSPLFVGLDRFDQIRVVRKDQHDSDQPMITCVRAASADDVAHELWNATSRAGPKFSADSLRPRLQALMTPWMNEGFFAEVVVLVEGESDRAVILGMAQFRRLNLDRHGIAVIPCNGKTNLDRPLIIFRQLGIPTYAIWDADKGANDAKPRTNRLLLSLLGRQEEDWPSFIGETGACFNVALEETLRDEIGQQIFQGLVSEIRDDLGIQKTDQALKHPVVLERTIRTAADEGHVSDSLKAILDNIVALKGTATMISS